SAALISLAVAPWASRSGPQARRASGSLVRRCPPKLHWRYARASDPAETSPAPPPPSPGHLQRGGASRHRLVFVPPALARRSAAASATDMRETPSRRAPLSSALVPRRS